MSGSEDGVQKARATEAILCRQGCGFYGSPTTLNMCSRCFAKQQKTPSPEETAAAAVAAAATVSENAARAEQSENDDITGVRNSGSSVADVEQITETLRRADGGVSLDRDGGEEEKQPAHEDPNEAVACVGEMKMSLVATKQQKSSSSTRAVRPSADGDGEQGPRRKVQKNKGRCFECRKKVGLTGFTCRCGYVFCGEHRYADQHACTFDYKSQAKELLTKANPVVVASKVDKI
eukprot:CAMPEP_0185847858 /NCGR_PEP_ID=MMETSP1354-20130828/2957_1 /TAXON_ID=708628 /ORGANISM="Erythrolobus madagascarensis, Strain CCMP3276" /LENGTH=233 /DNA_ID=CAMNT_0028548191 /DNA_START=118 /DNA_END=819 /DNA_ORIENTATION=-